MGIKKFMHSVEESLGLDESKKSSKQKSLKSFLKKEKKRKEELNISLKQKLDENALKEKKEELKIVSVHIKKAEKILAELESWVKTTYLPDKATKKAIGKSSSVFIKPIEVTEMRYIISWGN